MRVMGATKFSSIFEPQVVRHPLGAENILLREWDTGQYLPLPCASRRVGSANLGQAAEFSVM
jgi:hypothetical protein